MNSKKIITRALTIVCLLSCMSIIAFAQDEIDALRYSYLTTQGTARSIGFGSALGSVGGDFSSLSVNPAGIGVYRTSDVMITPAIRFNSTEGTYLGKTTTDNNTRFNFNNLGVVFTKAQKGRRYANSNWKTFSFGFGVNRVADFNRDYTYKGLNSGPGSSSGSEVFSVDANNTPGNVSTNGTPAFFGYQSYLIDFDTASGAYKTIVPWQSGINQARDVRERGGINEIAVTFGGNYQEKLMLGFTIGIPSLRYTRTANYTETDANNGSARFDSYTMSESLTTTGIGVNAKLGFIYKPADAFRIGVAIHTPTAYSLSDVYDQSLVANTQGYAVSQGGSDAPFSAPQNTFNYSLTTPWRGVVSATAMMGKIGFITADYEYVNYRSSRYRFTADNPSDEASYKEYEKAVNQSIKDAYTAASNFRVGAEVRIQPVMLRAGFGYYGSPYKNYTDANRMDFSAGLGFRFDHAYIDLGYVHSEYQNKEQPYVLPTTGGYAGVVVPSAVLKNNGNMVALTVGFKF